MADSKTPSFAKNCLDKLALITGMEHRMIVMLGALLAIWLVLNTLTGGIFLSARNLYNLSVQSSVVAIMATGMVLVIVTRHIDLSVGSLLGFVGMSIAWMQVELFPIGQGWWPLAIVFGVLIGAALGAMQGWWIAYQGIPAFVVTLGGLLMFRGAAFMVTEGRTVAPMDPTYQLLGGGINGSIGGTASTVLALLCIVVLISAAWYRRHKNSKNNKPQRSLVFELLHIGFWAGVILAFVNIMNSYTLPRSDEARGIPIPVLIMIGTVLVMTFIATRTRFGRYVFAIGGNPNAASLSGINVKKVTVFVFVVMGVLCAIAAVVTTARLNAGTNSMGTLAELNVIAAAVIGGTSLAGGAGTIPGAILGAVIMQSLDNGMVLLGVSSAMRMIVMGLVLVIAVWFDVAYTRRRQ
jgi:D-xylose transport system permease protein